jgi:hypothetical protein
MHGMNARSVLIASALAALLPACAKTESDLNACRDETERTMASTRPCEQPAAGPICEDVSRLRLTESCMAARGYRLDRKKLADVIDTDIRAAWKTASRDTAVWESAKDSSAR